MPGGKFSVYVIELDRAVLDEPKFRKRNPNADPEKECFYVGQTLQHIADRVRVHMEGERHYNRFVRKYRLKERPDIYEQYNPLFSRSDAEDKEKWLAEKLIAEGHGVWWN